MSETWRTVVRWQNVITGETGEIADSDPLPHALLIELLNKQVRIKLPQGVAVGSTPTIDPIAKTVEYYLDLYPQ